MRPTRLSTRVVVALKATALVVALVLLGRALASTDLRAAAARIHDLGPAALLVLVPFPIGLLLDATAWGLLLRRVGRAVPLARLFPLRVGTEAVTFALPAGGLVAEALGPVLLAPDPPIATSLTTSATKRWLIIRTHGYYVVLAAAAGWAALAERSRALVGHRGLPLVVAASGAGLVLVSFALERATSRLGLAKRLHDAVQRLQGSRLFGWAAARDLDRAAFERVDRDLAALGDARHPAPAALILGQWLLESVETYVILHVLGAPVDFVDVLSFDAALSVVRTAAVFAPAGLGVQDLGYLAFFTAYGIPNAAAIGPAFLVLKRAKELFWITTGFVVLAFARRAARDRRAVLAHQAPAARGAPPEGSASSRAGGAGSGAEPQRTESAA